MALQVDRQSLPASGLSAMVREDQRQTRVAGRHRRPLHLPSPECSLSPVYPFDSDMLITSPFQLCLAHYCDIHGPTPLMVTEGLEVPCNSCYENDATHHDAARPKPSLAVPSSAAAVVDAFRRLQLGSSNCNLSTSISAQDTNVENTTATTSDVDPSSSGIDTPPDSPLRAKNDFASLPPHPQRRDAARFRRTYDEYSTSRLQNPCESCALTLPSQQRRSNNHHTAYSTAHGTSGTMSQDASTPSASTAPVSLQQSHLCRESPASAIGLNTDLRGPTLRTRAPCARVYGISPSGTSDMATPPKSRDSSSDREGVGIRTSTLSTSGVSSTASHMHFLDYTSTHQPTHPESFSLIRASCLRTLSQETLPRPSTIGDGGVNNPTSPTATTMQASGFPSLTSQPHFVTTHSAGTAVAGGPIAFGDPTTGFTTAYVFRVTDVHARGNKRLYAFLALSTHKECQVMRTFSYLAAEFRELAAWIQSMAEREAERVAESRDVAPWMAGLDPNILPSQQSLNGDQRRDISSGPEVASNNGVGYFGGDRLRGPGASSFLAGGNRRYGGTMAGGSGGIHLRARGLAELVGMPNFFIELHAKFVRLLLELGVMLNS